MKLINQIIILTLLCSFLLNCDDSHSPTNTLFIGAWIDAGYEDNFRILKRSGELHENKGGYIFNTDHSLKDRKIMGWCGTPPVAYETYNGTWQQLSENKLLLISGYWGGIDTVEVEIVSLNNSELKLQYFYY